MNKIEEYVSLIIILLLLISFPAFNQVSFDLQISQMIQQVDSLQISAHIQNLATANGYNSRVTFTPGADWAAEYIYQKFSEMPGLTSVNYDTFTISGASSPWNTKPLVNVVATLQGSGQSSRYLIVSGHYDSCGDHDTGWSANWFSASAPGADDNASGIAVLLEIARVLSYPGNNFDNVMTIKFVAFAAEERAPAANNLNHQGSHHYAMRAFQRGDDIAGVYNIDMIGYNNRGYRYTNIVSNQNSEELGTRMLNVNQTYQLGVITNSPPFPEATYSDHERFWFYNYKAILLIENAPPWYSNLPYYAANTYYHTSQDTPEKVKVELVWSLTQLTLGTAAHFIETPTGMVPTERPIPHSFTLNPNYPNPFNSSTVFHYTLTEGGHVSMQVFNNAGEKVANPCESWQPAGEYRLNWQALDQSGNPLASGIYFVVLKYDNLIKTRKIMLIR